MNFRVTEEKAHPQQYQVRVRVCSRSGNFGPIYAKVVKAANKLPTWTYRAERESYEDHQRIEYFFGPFKKMFDAEEVAVNVNRIKPGRNNEISAWVEDKNRYVGDTKNVRVRVEYSAVRIVPNDEIAVELAIEDIQKEVENVIDSMNVEGEVTVKPFTGKRRRA